MAKRNQQAKTEKSTVAVRFVAILLMLVMLVGVVMAVLQFCTPVGQNLKPSEWFSKTEQNKPDDPNKPDDTDPDQPDKPNPPAAQGTGGGLVIPETVEGNGIMLLSAEIGEEDYADYGISPHSDSAYTILAELHPEYATDRSVVWTLGKAKDSDPWWEGKDPNDYVTLSVNEENPLYATVTCKQAFGADFQLRVESAQYSEAHTEVMIRYRKKMTGAGIIIESFTLSDNTVFVTFPMQTSVVNGQAGQFAVQPKMGIGTVDDTYTLTGVAGQLHSNQLGWFKTYASEHHTQYTTMGVALVNTLSSDISKEIQFSLTDKMIEYDLTSARGFFAYFSTESMTSEVAMRQALSLLTGYSKTGVQVQRNPFFSMEFTFTSEAGKTYVKTVDAYLGELKYDVTGITTDKDEIIF